VKCAIFVPLLYHSLSEGEIYEYAVSPKSSKTSFFDTAKSYAHIS